MYCFSHSGAFTPLSYFSNLSLSCLPITVYLISHSVPLITPVDHTRLYLTDNLKVDMVLKSHFVFKESERSRESEGGRNMGYWRVEEVWGWYSPSPASHTLTHIDTVAMTTPATATVLVANSQQKVLLFLASTRWCELIWTIWIHISYSHSFFSLSFDLNPCWFKSLKFRNEILYHTDLQWSYFKHKY